MAEIECTECYQKKTDCLYRYRFCVIVDRALKQYLEARKNLYKRGDYTSGFIVLQTMQTLDFAKHSAITKHGDPPARNLECTCSAFKFDAFGMG